MTLRNIDVLHYSFHTETGCGRGAKQKKIYKAKQFWYQTIPLVLTKKMYTHTWCFIHKQRSYKCLKFWSEKAELQRKLMEKAELIQMLIFSLVK